ncbi:MAG: hypothetical protein NTW87_33920 [Planctomycetota bacterium]|nr:hypothetical protein [Planctomycetota bacterium]
MERLSRALASGLFVTLLTTAAAGAEVIVIGGGDSGAIEKGALLPDGALVQSGIDEGLTRIVLSPDGRRAATAGEDGKVRIFDVATAKLATLAIAAHNTACHDVCFAVDGKTLFSCGADSTAREWDLATGKEVRKFEGHEGETRCVACSPDGQRLATTDKKGVRIWDLKTGKQLHLMSGHEVPKIPENMVALATTTSLTIDSLVFSPDGRTLISEANDETARVWDTVRGKELRTVPQHGR